MIHIISGGVFLELHGFMLKHLLVFASICFFDCTVRQANITFVVSQTSLSLSH